MMSALFCAKWEPMERHFVEYFGKQWLGAHSNWFEGAANYTPSTNNALESHNAVIKRKVTFRKRLPLNQFLIAMKDMTEDISTQLSKGKRVIEEEPTMTKDMWRKAAEMHQTHFKSFKAKGSTDDKSTYVVPSSQCDIDNANEKCYKSLTRREWQSFDEYIDFGFHQFWITTVSMTDWKISSTCSCPCFFKQYMCKHVMALAVKEKLVELPVFSNPVPLAKKRKPGAISKAKKALHHQ